MCLLIKEHEMKDGGRMLKESEKELRKDEMLVTIEGGVSALHQAFFSIPLVYTTYLYLVYRAMRSNRKIERKKVRCIVSQSPFGNIRSK